MVDIDLIYNDLEKIQERLEEFNRLGFLDFCPELDDPEIDALDGTEDFMDAIFDAVEKVDDAMCAIRTMKEEMEKDND